MSLSRTGSLKARHQFLYSADSAFTRQSSASSQVPETVTGGRAKSGPTDELPLKYCLFIEKYDIHYTWPS